MAATTITPSSTGSGIDVTSTVDQLMAIERQPETAMKAQQTALNTKASAIGTINNALADLQSKVAVLTDFSGQLGARTVTSSDSTLLTATADGTAPLANHQIVINNLAATSSFYSNTLSTRLNRGNARQLRYSGERREDENDHARFHQQYPGRRRGSHQ